VISHPSYVEFCVIAGVLQCPQGITAGCPDAYSSRGNTVGCCHFLWLSSSFVSTKAVGKEALWEHGSILLLLQIYSHVLETIAGRHFDVLDDCFPTAALLPHLLVGPLHSVVSKNRLFFYMLTFFITEINS
jgi:hypothetical protein